MTAYLLRREDLGQLSCDGIAALSTTGIKAYINKKDALPVDADLCIRWGCTGNIPGERVVNTARSIHLVHDKAGFRRTLNEEGLSPVTWTEAWGKGKMMFPCVVRPRIHQEGKNFYLCSNQTEMEMAAIKCGEGWYASQYVDKVAEYRICCMQGRVLLVINKSPADPSDLVWGRGKTTIVNWDGWPLEGIKKALASIELSGLDFAGVDVIKDKQGNYYVLELNTAPYLEGQYQRQCFTKGFDWIVEHGKKRIELQNVTDNWKKFIHPAISDRAII